jgi:chromosome segregation ATPase
MSDTPRTDAAYFKPHSTMYDLAGEMKRIERELNEANERIQRLEEGLMDAKNKHAALVADVALYEDRGERIKRLDETLEAVTDKIDNAWGIYMKFKEAKP